MKFARHILACLFLVASLASAQETYESFAAAYGAANTLRNQKKFDEAFAAADAAIALAGTPAEQADAFYRKGDIYWSRGRAPGMVESNFLVAVNVEGLSDARRAGIARELVNKCYSGMDEAGFAKGTNFVSALLAEPAMTNLDHRITLVEQLAELYFARGVVDAARDSYDKLARTPGLTPAQRGRIASGSANLRKRLCEYDAAVAGYVSIYRDAALPVNDRMHAFNAAAGIRRLERKDDATISDARKLLADETMKPKQRDLSTALLTALRHKGDFAAARALAESFLQSKDAGEAKFGALQLLHADLAADDFERVKRDLANHHAAYSNENAILRDTGKILMDRQDYEGALACFENIARHAHVWVERDAVRNRLLCYHHLGRPADLVACVADMTAKKYFNAVDTAGFNILAARYTKPEQPIDMEAVKAVVRELEPAQKGEALAWAAKQLISVGDSEAARALYTYRQTLFNAPARNTAAVRYVRNAPRDVGSWLSSGLLKDKSGRHDVTHVYGAQEATFLVTDVMAAGRKVGDAGVEADKETYFHVCYDEYGIHLFFVGVDSRFRDVLAGALGGSGYEMYLALGEGGPPYQWLFEQPRDKLDIPPWNSPNPYYRHMKEYVTISSQPVENGFATAMNFDWALAYDRLPENGDTWPFELIRWTCGGGVPWGGKQVWQIGNWGRLVFEGMTPQVRQAIREIIIRKALARYRAEREPRRGGLIAIWQDAELGDPAFYAARVAPLVEKLDDYATLVKSGMDGKTSDLLYREAVPLWYDFRYAIDDLRTEYLTHRLTE